MGLALNQRSDVVSSTSDTNMTIVHGWTDIELNNLMGMFGDIPYFLIMGRYNSWAVMAGYKKRTQKEIDWVTIAGNCETEAYGTYYPLRYLRDTLGVHQDTVRVWKRKKLIIVAQKNHVVQYVLRKSVIELAKKKPHLFGSLSKIQLLSLLDESTADFVLSRAEYCVPGRAIKVKCLERNRIYPSIRCAAKETHQSPERISRCVKMNIKCLDGFHWRIA